MAVYLCRTDIRIFAARRWWQFFMPWKYAWLPRQDRPGYVPGTILGLFRDAEVAMQTAKDMGLEDYTLEDVLPLHEGAFLVTKEQMVSA